jgi:hypothetical protein
MQLSGLRRTSIFNYERKGQLTAIPMERRYRLDEVRDFLQTIQKHKSKGEKYE